MVTKVVSERLPDGTIKKRRAKEESNYIHHESMFKHRFQKKIYLIQPHLHDCDIIQVKFWFGKLNTPEVNNERERLYEF